MTRSPRTQSTSATPKLVPWTAALAMVLAASLVLLVACEPKSPEERVAKLRAGYVVEVNPSGFVATANFPEPEMPLEGEAMEGEDAQTPDADTMTDEMDGATNDDMPPAAMEPESYDIVLDLVIKNGNRESLSELTVDIIHLDSDRKEKERWLVAFPTDNILPGSSSQLSHRLEAIPYQEGDMFTAEVRMPVPPAERGEYSEFGS